MEPRGNESASEYHRNEAGGPLCVLPVLCSERGFKDLGLHARTICVIRKADSREQEGNARALQYKAVPCEQADVGGVNRVLHQAVRSMRDQLVRGDQPVVPLSPKAQRCHPRLQTSSYCPTIRVFS